MKKLIVILILLLPVLLWAADTKIEDQTKMYVPSADDLFAIIDDPNGTPLGRAIPVWNLENYLVTSPTFITKIDIGADDTIAHAYIHDAGTLVFYDDSDDTTVTLGPVQDGTTTITLTGSMAVSGIVGVPQIVGSAGAFVLGANTETIAINSSDWDIGTTGDMTGIGSITSNGTISATAGAFIALTEGGNAVYNATEVPGGELGGTFASFTIDDGVAVTNWNLTTPTITTSLTTSTPTTLTVAELDRLDGLAGIIVTDVTACTDIEGTGLSIAAGVLNWSAASTDLTDTADLLYEAELDTFAELDTQIADKALVNMADGATWLGTHDYSGATVTMPTRLANEAKHLMFNLWNPNSLYDNDTQVCIWPLTDAAITITKIEVTCDADPATELVFDLKWADAFIGLANAAVIDEMDTTNGTTSISAGFDDATVASGKCIYVEFQADPDAAIKQVCINITFDYD